ncbi:MAG: formylglycine-generating enzyme family protein [Candidatus Electrothrix sp. AR3]|nr:formylglycine-generating enzyme family protein [Candidatus Electrothrix sp. AR3]
MDEIGLYADLGMKGTVVQRFRWVNPGTFIMGSPKDEPERESWGRETQHQVTLSKGFWLADTAVTQKLWQAVMGKNPARFKGEYHPVENVNWMDIQQFLTELNRLIPVISARFPTEAEWEYACRAGTTTPFSFGDKITSSQVNYNGNYPYHKGVKGTFRQKTVAVKSLPCNLWGLYAMHGNLWEWCQDFWQEDLLTEMVIDPIGPKNGDFRLVRGGSWFINGRGVRSAIRGRFSPEFGNDRIGFRLALDHLGNSVSPFQGSRIKGSPDELQRQMIVK